MLKEFLSYLFPFGKHDKAVESGGQCTYQSTNNKLANTESSKTIYIDAVANSRIEIIISVKPQKEKLNVETTVKPISNKDEADENNNTKTSKEVSLTTKPKVDSTLEKKEATKSDPEKAKEEKVELIEPQSVSMPKKEEKCKINDSAKSKSTVSVKGSALASSSHLPSEIPIYRGRWSRFINPIKQHGRLDMDCYCWIEDAYDFFRQTPNVKEVYGQYVKKVNISYSFWCHDNVRQDILECRYDESRYVDSEDSEDSEEEEVGEEDYLFDRLLYNEYKYPKLEYILQRCPNIENVKFEGVDYNSKIKEHFSKVEFSKMSGK